MHHGPRRRERRSSPRPPACRARPLPSADGQSLDVDSWATPVDPGAPVVTAELGEFDHLPPIFGPGVPVVRLVAPPVDAPWPTVA